MHLLEKRSHIQYIVCSIFLIISMGDGPLVTDHIQYKYPIFPHSSANLLSACYTDISVTVLYHTNRIFIPHASHFYSTPNTFLFHTRHISIPHPTHFYSTPDTYLFRIILSLIHRIAISTRLSLFQEVWLQKI